MIRSILVPLDGSDFAEHALPLAAGLARKAGATLPLAHVHQPPSQFPASGPTLDAANLQARQHERDYLADVARRLGNSGPEEEPLRIETALLFGGIAEALKVYAERESADLVVMATHARGALGRVWQGCVADDARAMLAAPVLLVRPGEGKPDLDRGAGLSSVVVPLDGSDLAEEAIGPAVELARLFDAEVALVRVNRPGLLMIPLPVGAAQEEDAQRIEEREREEARRYLDRVAEGLKARGVRCRADVLIGRDPADGILAEAEARHADVVALETHARRGLARFFLGSVADDVLRNGHSPVLLHHHHAAV